ncbi:alpha-L-iduronidase-like [Sycon ciliatum]|uniref:alpha-L-iduronidase-like n=1 Tax=Sycon ciliatum TaxID=27933 RepID=UPI0031F71833
MCSLASFSVCIQICLAITITWSNFAQGRMSGARTENGGSYSVTVDASHIVAPLDRFWRSTGFCPPLPHQNFSSYVITEDEMQNIALIGSVARRGIEQVRIHWLLDLVTVTGESSTNLTYDFSTLDILMDWLHRSQLRPGFEIMGNPSGYFTSFDNKTQVILWKDLVQQVAAHYITRYGLAEVAQWNFETWNEPSNKDFDNLDITIEGFLNYYDACSEGLLAVDPSLRLGGPGDGCRDTQMYCWAFLAHCANGTNYFTGKTGVRVDFISFHHKGKGSSDYILDTSNDTIYAIRRQYPQLAHVDIYNDEADPVGGWNKLEDWRGDVSYAAMVVKVIAEHQNMFLSTAEAAAFTRYALLSNDNGFLNWDPVSHFNERTLTTRFRMNLTTPRSVEMIKKPVLSVMSLLALLGENQLLTSWKPDTNKGTLGSLATVHKPNSTDPMDSWELVVILYSSDDTSDTVDTSHVSLDIVNIPDFNENAGEIHMHFYKMNNDATNPFGIFTEASKPDYPTKDLLARMRACQEPQSQSIGLADHRSKMAVEGRIDLSFTLDMPGVTVLHVCQQAASPPPQVTGLWLHNVTSSEVLVTWHGVDVRCLFTYQVMYSTSGPTGTYSQANSAQPLISSSFIHALSASDVEKMAAASASVSYRIQAVDYGGRKGPASDPISISL